MRLGVGDACVTSNGLGAPRNETVTFQATQVCTSYSFVNSKPCISNINISIAHT